MINTVTINGKDHAVHATYGDFRRITKKYPDMDKIAEWTVAKYDEFIFDALWMVLRRRWYGLKPFITKNRLADLITMPELNTIRAGIHTILLGSDEDGSSE